MSNRGRVHTVKPSWRKIRAALPALALVGGGIAVFAVTSTADASKDQSVSKGSPAVVVPDTAIRMPAPGSSFDDPFEPGPPEAPGLVLPDGTVPGSSTAVTLDRTGIPVLALEAYRRAASLVDTADPACHIDWALVGAIGRVESDHARFGGNHLDSGGVAQPGIIGIALDGSNGTARITDTDGGTLDRDTAYDRAVGPMQFIPGTWRVVGSDADGDGVRNPQDMADAATATAIYLCSGPGDLSAPDDLRAAIMRYNASDSYVRTVIAIADAYRHGVTELPASDLPAAGSASSGSASSGSARSGSDDPGTSEQPATTPPAKKPTPLPAATGSPAGSSDQPPAPAPLVDAPAPVAPQPIPALPVPALPIPVTAPTPGSPPLTKTVCTIGPLGVKVCTLVPLDPPPTQAP